MQQIKEEIKETKVLNQLKFNELVDISGVLMTLEKAISLKLFSWRKEKGKILNDRTINEKEIEGLITTLKLQIEKKSDFEGELVITNDDEKKFSLKKKISKLESEIAENRNKLDELNKSLHDDTH